MRRVLVVGSGPSGVHFALTVLQKGYEVLMLDVGRSLPEHVHPEASVGELRSVAPDPADYFLGSDFEAVSYPGAGGEYYAIPPRKRPVFEGVPAFGLRSDGFAPLVSFGRGGLAEAWTAGVYPFNERELEDFPFTYREIEPYYSEIARRIGINGEADELARFFPVHEHLLPPLRLDAHSTALLEAYDSQRGTLRRELGGYLGRSRIAALTHDRGEERKACSYCGRCLWGCPSHALYTPSITLRECHRFPGFQYVPDVYVRYFRTDANRRVTAVVAEPLAGGNAYEFPVDRLVLAAGTLSSSRIFLESVYRATGEVLVLPGLMDNQQIIVPFLNLRMLGRPPDPASYQYHQLALGLENEPGREYVHGQITTLTTALAHPIIQSVPLDLRTAAYLYRHTRTALGMVNVNLHDVRRTENHLTLEPRSDSAHPRLVVRYRPAAGERQTIRSTVRRLRRVLRRLGCIVPPGLTHVRPKGASVHYAGTLPMSSRAADLTLAEDCRSRDFPNLYFVDGTGFPFLPAKNITFTLMANAVRVAETAF